jgi:choline dehydrogenase-like flavoprotein
MSHFEYIIVGAGSAGCVLANRLTEDASCRVLLIEAGGKDNSPLIRTPAASSALQDSEFDWADLLSGETLGHVPNALSYLIQKAGGPQCRGAGFHAIMDDRMFEQHICRETRMQGLFREIRCPAYRTSMFLVSKSCSRYRVEAVK